MGFNSLVCGLATNNWRRPWVWLYKIIYLSILFYRFIYLRWPSSDRRMHAMLFSITAVACTLAWLSLMIAMHIYSEESWKVVTTGHGKLWPLCTSYTQLVWECLDLCMGGEAAFVNPTISSLGPCGLDASRIACRHWSAFARHRWLFARVNLRAVSWSIRDCVLYSDKMASGIVLSTRYDPSSLALYAPALYILVYMVGLAHRSRLKRGEYVVSWRETSSYIELIGSIRSIQPASCRHEIAS